MVVVVVRYQHLPKRNSGYFHRHLMFITEELYVTVHGLQLLHFPLKSLALFLWGIYRGLGSKCVNIYIMRVDANIPPPH